MARAVFLSYASQDADAVSRIRDGLASAGIEVWLDQAELKGGDAWDAAIRKRIRECALFVPVVSAATEVRDEGYFRLEWKLAVDRSHLIAEDRAFLVPAALGGVAQQFARVPERFKDVQWSPVTSDDDIARFASHVLRLLEGGPPAQAAPALAPAAERSRAASIAVLPFVNISREPDNEYFADGLSEELLNVLANIKGLRVTSRTSAFTFKNKEVGVALVARQLGVANVLEGSVRRAGTRVRVTAKLIDAASDSQVWSRSYDRELDDIFAVQDDIARGVVMELRRSLLGEADAAPGGVAAEVEAASVGRKTEPEAYRLYLQGRFFALRATEDDMAKAMGYYHQAIERDPRFALGWTGLSSAHFVRAAHGWIPPAEGFAQARAAAERAFEFQPDLPEAHVCLGRACLAEFDWKAASEAFERALALSPENAVALRAMGRFKGCMGRPLDGLGHTLRSVELDPLNAGGHFDRAVLSMYAGRLEDAELAIRRALELNPSGGASHSVLSTIRLLAGRFQEALEEIRLEVLAEECLYIECMVEHSLGHRERSDEALAKYLSLGTFGKDWQLVQIHAWRGEIDAAFEWLERAYTEKDLGMSQLLVDPFVRNLRGDPRWRAMLQRTGLPAP